MPCNALSLTELAELSGSSSLNRCQRKLYRKSLVANRTPTTMNGLKIPVKHATTLVGGELLLCVSEVQDSKKILIFGDKRG